MGKSIEHGRGHGNMYIAADLLEVRSDPIRQTYISNYTCLALHTSNGLLEIPRGWRATARLTRYITIRTWTISEFEYAASELADLPIQYHSNGMHLHFLLSHSSS